MNSIDIIVFLSDPFVISYHVLLFLVLPVLIVMLKGKAVDGNKNKVWTNRSAGLEPRILSLVGFNRYVLLFVL